MRFVKNEDAAVVQEIVTALKNNGGYCPCRLDKTPETKCVCKDFIENVKAGEYCHCGLYKKLEN